MTEAAQTGADGGNASAEGSDEPLLRVVVPVTGAEVMGTAGLAEPLRRCLASLVEQSEPGWELGRHWEIVVTVSEGELQDKFGPMRDVRGLVAEVAREQPGVRLVEAGPTPAGWTERAHACSVGADATVEETGSSAAGSMPRWLLFTHPEAIFLSNGVSRSIVEAERYGAQMLSYAPLEVLRGFARTAVMPLILSELANAYPAQKVNDPERRLGYADERFLLMSAAACRATGGYAAVAGSPTPEVDLAFLAKRRRVALRYRYAPEALASPSAPGLAALRRQWTPRLALLIDNALLLGVWRALDAVLIVGLPVLAYDYAWAPVARTVFLLLWARTLWRIYGRARKSNCVLKAVALCPLGLPAFVALLVESRIKRGAGSMR